MKNDYSKLTKQLYEKGGYFVENVETGKRGTYLKQDLLGVFDFIAFARASEIYAIMIGIQSTDSSHRAAHVRTILSEPRALLWLWSGQMIHLVSWKVTGHTQSEIERTVKVEIIEDTDFPKETVLKAKILIGEISDHKNGSTKNCERHSKAAGRGLGARRVESISGNSQRVKSLPEGRRTKKADNVSRQTNSNFK